MFPSIRHQIQSYSPDLIPADGKKQAAVALILRNADSSPEIFFIERSNNSNDPWSGQIAFPGGNRETGDESTADTALRETYEEVGLMLSKKELQGRLDDQQGRNNYNALPLVISCFVFSMKTDQQPKHNYEVGDSLWVSVEHLLDAENRINCRTAYSPHPGPGIVLTGNRVLWGLTYRFVERFLQIVA